MVTAAPHDRDTARRHRHHHRTYSRSPQSSSTNTRHRSLRQYRFFAFTSTIHFTTSSITLSRRGTSRDRITSRLNVTSAIVVTGSRVEPRLIYHHPRYRSQAPSSSRGASVRITRCYQPETSSSTLAQFARLRLRLVLGISSSGPKRAAIARGLAPLRSPGRWSFSLSCVFRPGSLCGARGYRRSFRYCQRVRPLAQKSSPMRTSSHRSTQFAAVRTRWFRAFGPIRFAGSASAPSPLLFRPLVCLAAGLVAPSLRVLATWPVATSRERKPKRWPAVGRLTSLLALARLLRRSFTQSFAIPLRERPAPAPAARARLGFLPGRAAERNTALQPPRATAKTAIRRRPSGQECFVQTGDTRTHRVGLDWPGYGCLRHRSATASARHR